MTIENFIEDYEKARENKTLVEWRLENRHPNMLKNLTELQQKWEKISECHAMMHVKSERKKDAMRPRHVEVKIKEAKVYTFDGMFVYPVKPEKSIRLYYPKGSFQKGTGFDVSQLNGRWYLVWPLYSDDYIKMYLETKDHYMYDQSPECFELVTY